MPLSLPHDPAMGADDFLVTPCNRDCVAWVEKWPHWPSHGLIVTGEAGSGKTHLLNLWLGRSAGVAITLPQLIAQDAATVTQQSKMLALDDADVAAGNDIAEEKLFHLYNHLQQNKGSLLLTMKKGAGQAGFMLPDLRSRLLALPATSLGAPDDMLLQALIVKQFRDRQIYLDSGVVAYLTPRMTRDAGGIRDLVERLDHASLAAGRKITIALARRVMEGGDG